MRLLWTVLLLLMLAGCAAAEPADTSQPDSVDTPATLGEDFSQGGDVTSGDTAVVHDTVDLPDPAESDVIEIKEKMFVAQTNDVYLNPEDYLGKTIKYEGIFDVYYWEETDFTFYSVIRYGPGCCGYDAYAGFEVAWDGEYPKQDDWVEAVGVLESYEEDGSTYLLLRLSSLTVMDVRGEEYVYQ